jgi:hypothetical protein
MSHNSSRRECCQRDRANLALGQLAVVLERVIGQPRCQANNACIAARDDVDRDRVERVDLAS